MVFTKADLVDEEWAGLVNDDVDNLVRGTFMENADAFRYPPIPEKTLMC